jgi:hypothetical protein
MKWSTTKKILLGILLFILVGVMCFAWILYEAVHRWGVEGRIHGTFFPVVHALFEYEDATGAPAKSLQDLIPKYLDAIPTCSIADSVSYRLLDNGKDWELAIRSTALRKPRVYVHRSNKSFTPEEEKKIVLHYHGVWYVLEE